VKLKFGSGVAIALALSLGIVWGGVVLSGWVRGSVRESTVYRQSMIISSMFSGEDELGMGTVLTDARARGLLLRFARAVTRAYVSFELIPYGQLETFSVVLNNLGPTVEVEDFEYRGHDLIITGTALDQANYREFLSGLMASDYFGDVRGNFREAAGGVHFEIVCVAPERQGSQVL